MMEWTTTYSVRNGRYYLNTIHIQNWLTFNNPATRQQVKFAHKNEVVVTNATSDPEKIRKTAHRIKPTIDNFGIDDLKQDIRSIEAMAKEGLVSPELEFLIDRLADVIARVAGELENEKP